MIIIHYDPCTCQIWPRKHKGIYLNTDIDSNMGHGIYGKKRGQGHGKDTGKRYKYVYTIILVT